MQIIFSCLSTSDDSFYEKLSKYLPNSHFMSFIFLENNILLSVFLRWEDVADDKLRVNKTENEYKAALIRGWIGGKGTQYLHKYKWTRTNDKTMR